MFQSRLRELRLRAGFDSWRGFTAELNRCGYEITPSTVGRFEKGEANPTWEIVLAIADYFKVSVDYLMCRDEYVSDKETAKKNVEAEDLPPELKRMVRQYLDNVERERKR